MIRFKSLSSGSCGNCYYLDICSEEGQSEAAVIIDAGVSLRRLRQELVRDALSADRVCAILVTHDHMDHIRALGSWCKHLKTPVWATGTLHRALAHNRLVVPWIHACRRVLAGDGWTEIVPGRIKVRPFVVPHDATQTVGYAVLLDAYKYVIMTDIGQMTAEALSYARHADTVVVESNYDPDMLDKGPYPYELKVRIRSGNGHLSTPQCAEAIRMFNHDGLRNVFLCHLSEHNNTPELALASARTVLDGVSPRLVALPRDTPSPLFHI